MSYDAGVNQLLIEVANTVEEKPEFVKFKMRTNHQEVLRWIIEILKLGIKDFKLRDLPPELQIKRMVIKGSNAEYIESLGKEKSINKWRISEEGIKMALRYMQNK